MDRWMYLVVRKGDYHSWSSNHPDLDLTGDLAQVLETITDAGWELMHISGDPEHPDHPMIFRRPKPEAS